MSTYSSSNFDRFTLSRRGLLSLGGGIVGAALLGTAGCGTGANSSSSAPASGPADVAKAKKDGQVVVYTGAGEDSVVGWAKHFTDKYGIQVKVVRKATYPLWQQWQTELKAGKHLADILMISDKTLFDTAIGQKQLMNFSPTSSDDYDATYTKPGWYYPLQLVSLGIVYNTKVNSPADIEFIKQQGFNALPDPRFKGVEPVVSPASGGTDYTWWYLLMQVQAEKYGDDFVKKMAALSPKVYTSTLPVYSQVESGQYRVAGAASESSLGLDWSRGAPIRWTFPDPTPVNTLTQAVAATAPHPNAAVLFQEWATTVEGEEAWYDGNWSLGAPMNSKAKDVRDFSKADWYQAPKNVYTQWATDPNYAKMQSSLISHWTSLMGGGGN
ncbi:MAG TPA: substrate-binding domain-containing protein [Amycolatopsis sp.]|nr:substrate-binding domain-containing protein [Amycolatopsis sp.]